MEHEKRVIAGMAGFTKSVGQKAEWRLDGITARMVGESLGSTTCGQVGGAATSAALQQMGRKAITAAARKEGVPLLIAIADLTSGAAPRAGMDAFRRVAAHTSRWSTRTTFVGGAIVSPIAKVVGLIGDKHAHTPDEYVVAAAQGTAAGVAGSAASMAATAALGATALPALLVTVFAVGAAVGAATVVEKLLE